TCGDVARRIPGVYLACARRDSRGGCGGWDADSTQARPRLRKKCFERLVKTILSRVMFRNMASEGYAGHVSEASRDRGSEADQGDRSPADQDRGSQADQSDRSPADQDRGGEADPDVSSPADRDRGGEGERPGDRRRERVDLTDPKAMRALAHPLRWA